MEKDKMISIIIPIYNVQKYLEKCIDSVLNQTYKNIEVILVDDGSPDNSGDICEKYRICDNRVVVIHKENGGLSSARNVGLDIAKGQYIGFVDSDDWIEQTMYEKMISYMVENECDLVECGVNLVYGNQIKKFIKNNSCVLSGKEALEFQLKATETNFIPRVAVWSKLYKREFWDKRRFPEGKIHEDYMLTCEALYEAERVGIIKQGLYNHLVTNSNSIVNTKFGKKDLFLEFQNQERVRYLHEKGEEKLEFLAKRQYFYNILTLYWKCALNNMEESKYYLKILKSNKEEILKTITDSHILQYKVIWIFPECYLFMRRLVQILKKIKG